MDSPMRSFSRPSIQVLIWQQLVVHLNWQVKVYGGRLATWRTILELLFAEIGRSTSQRYWVRFIDKSTKVVQ